MRHLLGFNIVCCAIYRESVFVCSAICCQSSSRSAPSFVWVLSYGAPSIGSHVCVLRRLPGVRFECSAIYWGSSWEPSATWCKSNSSIAPSIVRASFRCQILASIFSVSFYIVQILRLPSVFFTHELTNDVWEDREGFMKSSRDVFVFVCVSSTLLFIILIVFSRVPVVLPCNSYMMSIHCIS